MDDEGTLSGLTLASRYREFRIASSSSVPKMAETWDMGLEAKLSADVCKLRQRRDIPWVPGINVRSTAVYSVSLHKSSDSYVDPRTQHRSRSLPQHSRGFVSTIYVDESSRMRYHFYPGIPGMGEREETMGIHESISER